MNEFLCWLSASPLYKSWLVEPSCTQMSRITLTVMFIMIMESELLEFVENFPFKCKTELVESVKPELIS